MSFNTKKSTSPLFLSAALSACSGATPAPTTPAAAPVAAAPAPADTPIRATCGEQSFDVASGALTATSGDLQIKDQPALNGAQSCAFTSAAKMKITCSGSTDDAEVPSVSFTVEAGDAFTLTQAGEVSYPWQDTYLPNYKTCKVLSL
jgi:hypothetical protein